MAEIWGINIYFVWNITIAPLSVCRDFLVIMCICVTNHVPFLLTVRYFVKNAYIMQFFLKMAERWGINIYVAWNTTIVPLSLCRTFFIYNPYLRDKSRSFLITGRYFVKMITSYFYLKMAEGWGINIYFIWKTTIVHLSMSSFISCELYLREKSRSSLAQQGKFHSRNHDISNFFSKWRNAGV